jgi:hypothetical protein
MQGRSPIAKRGKSKTGAEGVRLVIVMGGPFSHRHGYTGEQEIIIREDAPEVLRAGLVNIGRDCGMTYHDVREVVCTALHRFPDPNNWSEVPNLRDEVIDLVRDCDWYRIYDIAESLHRYLSERGRGEQFAQRLNTLFQQEGIGWQMVDGQIVTRGAEEFEYAVVAAVAELGDANLLTAKSELEEARRDLSRRPEPDLTGTVQHCMAALEATARVLADNPRATLGEILGHHAADLGIPRPLDTALQQMWGYASEMGRHLREGRNPAREEAELLLGAASVMINYLLQRRRAHI